jgi:hypothetical protein
MTVTTERKSTLEVVYKHYFFNKLVRIRNTCCNVMLRRASGLVSVRVFGLSVVGFLRVYFPVFLFSSCFCHFCILPV